MQISCCMYCSKTTCRWYSY